MSSASGPLDSGAMPAVHPLVLHLLPAPAVHAGRHGDCSGRRWRGAACTRRARSPALSRARQGARPIHVASNDMISKRRILYSATLPSLMTLVSSCTAPGTDPAAFASSASPCATPSRIVYVESNDPRAGENAILAFTRAEDGSLTPLAGGPFLTQGTGVGNPKQEFGPDDSDQEIATSSDRRFLFAVNSGSNTVAVFRIAADGALSAVPGSPFDSEGGNPVSVGVAGNHLVVVNKAQDPAHLAPARPPNYTVFSIMPDGALRHVPGSTIETTRGLAHAGPDLP